MKIFCLSAGLIGAASATINSLEHLDFAEWKEHHDISYESVGEDRIRAQHFLRTKEFVVAHNNRYRDGEESFHVALNAFAAMPNDEFVQKYTMPSWEAGTYGVSEEERDGASMYTCPTKYTGTSHSNSYSGSSYTTSVKNQGSCGSCWSFAAAAAMEAAFCKAGTKKCSSWSGLSSQQMVDCMKGNSALKPYDCNGCNGCWASNGMHYVFSYSKGIENWSDYGYTGKEGSCKYSSSKSVGKISSCGRLGSAKNQNNMCAMIQSHGPSAVAIDASGVAFQTYSGGIYTGGSCSSTRLNHAVTATGFTSNSLDVKNSWGSSWGDKGYIHFAKDGKTNTCGVYSEGQYGIV